MTDAPQRIWVGWPNPHSCGLAFTVPANPRLVQTGAGQLRSPYILATPASLAAAPEVRALIREAEARGMERAAKRRDARAESLVADHGSHEWDTNVTNLPEWVERATEELEEQATAIRAEAAAIRAAKGEPE